jgi:hypothetical protein
MKDWHALTQSHQTKSAVLLQAAGGDEALAARIYTWAQNREYAGKETLVAGIVELGRAQRGDTAALPDAKALALARAYLAHRQVADALPPAAPIVLTNNPMQPVPDIRAMIGIGRQQLTPQYLQQMQERGLTYVGTGAAILVRHGKTEHNANPGGVAGGSARGPWGAQLIPQAQQEATSLRPTMQALSNQGIVDRVIVSTVDRAMETHRRATQDVTGLPPPEYRAENNEYRVGGFLNLPKIDPSQRSAAQPSAETGGALVGPSAGGSTGVDFNNMPRDWVPSNDVYLPDVPRFGGSPVRAQGETESRLQHLARSSEGFRMTLNSMASGRAVMFYTHQFDIGNKDHFVFGDQDYMRVGHGIPNVAPQYWVVHVFKDAQGNLVPIGALAGQGDLAPPGPRGQ